MLAGQLALVVAALFSGAALYINWAEHPARLGLATDALLAEWKPAYERGFLMQASLALTGFVLGLIAWWQSGEWLWVLGAVLLVLNWPYTLLAIEPVNRSLKATDVATAGAEARASIEKWGRLHTVRTALGLAATLTFLAASLIEDS
jgi:uncharacterized membrane protein